MSFPLRDIINMPDNSQQSNNKQQDVFHVLLFHWRIAFIDLLLFIFLPLGRAVSLCFYSLVLCKNQNIAYVFQKSIGHRHVMKLLNLASLIYVGNYNKLSFASYPLCKEEEMQIQFYLVQPPGDETFLYIPLDLAVPFGYLAAWPSYSWGIPSNCKSLQPDLIKPEDVKIPIFGGIWVESKRPLLLSLCGSGWPSTIMWTIHQG